MILLLDVGNSRLKWALARGDRIRRSGAVAHRGAPARALRVLEVPPIEAVWMAHVVGPHERRLAAAIRRRFGVAPHIARTQKSCAGLRVAYARPSRLGVDRWLGMLALWTAGHRSFCIATAGTALTFDAVDARGRHRGGLIAPGLATAWNAVRGSTRFALPPRPSRYGRGLGTDTEACVRQGALYACAGLVERAAREAGGRRFLAGGDAQALRPHLEGQWTPRPDLVLEGLLAYTREQA
ncbi:MAG: type III pantothenate kinase [Gammaproteobacteria bacterium]